MAYKNAIPTTCTLYSYMKLNASEQIHWLETTSMWWHPMHINYCAHADTKVSYTIVLTIPCAINASPNHKYACEFFRRGPSSKWPSRLTRWPCVGLHGDRLSLHGDHVGLHGDRMEFRVLLQTACHKHMRNVAQVHAQDYHQNVTEPQNTGTASQA